jgi:hypothetical protein
MQISGVERKKVLLDERGIREMGEKIGEGRLENGRERSHIRYEALDKADRGT